MQIRVYNKYKILIQTIKGSQKDGVFNYKEGGILGFGASNKRMVIDDDKTFYENNQKIAQVIYDGKDYIQIDPFQNDKLFQIERKTSSADALVQSRLTRLETDAMIDKPLGLTQLLSYLMIIALVGALIIFYLELKDIIYNQQQVLAPFTQSIQQNQFNQKLILNYSERNLQVYNLTLAELRTICAKINCGA